MDFISISDPRVLSIPIKECNEPLVDLKETGEILFGPSPEIENNPCYTKMRQGVFLRLAEAQKMLPNSIYLCLYEGLRTLSLQEMLFNERWKRVSSLYPKWSESEIFYEVVKMVAPVTNLDGTINTPPHSTGGAVDVYLVDAKGNPLDMGILAKDWMQDVDGSLSKTVCESISDEAKKNRRLLSHVMTDAGFVNMPTEYWHWSYGDRYWAYWKKKNSSIYCSI